MITIVWDPSRFHLIPVLPNGCKFNSSYSLREMLESLSEWRREQAGGAGRKLIVHADNTRPHTQRQHHKNSWRRMDLERAIHSPYSPDLAPSDFCLFSHVKHCLRGQSFEMADELFFAMDAVLRGIDEPTLHATFFD
jgi:histone-lysine N-methyltransferase SETMAR